MILQWVEREDLLGLVLDVYRKHFFITNITKRKSRKRHLTVMGKRRRMIFKIFIQFSIFQLKLTIWKKGPALTILFLSWPNFLNPIEKWNAFIHLPVFSIGCSMKLIYYWIELNWYELTFSWVDYCKNVSCELDSAAAHNMETQINVTV